MQTLKRKRQNRLRFTVFGDFNERKKMDFNINRRELLIFAIRSAMIGDFALNIGARKVFAEDKDSGFGRFSENIEIEEDLTTRFERQNGRSDISRRPILGGRRLVASDLRAGDVLATRWADERKNTSPGFWNHLAIIGVDPVTN